MFKQIGASLGLMLTLLSPISVKAQESNTQETIFQVSIDKNRLSFKNKQDEQDFKEFYRLMGSDLCSQAATKIKENPNLTWQEFNYKPSSEFVTWMENHPSVMFGINFLDNVYPKIGEKQALIEVFKQCPETMVQIQ